MTFSLEVLRRWPDVEATDLPAADAADRLILDESAAARARAGDGELVVVGDGWGALALGAASSGNSASGCIRTRSPENVRSRRTPSASSSRTP